MREGLMPVNGPHLELYDLHSDKHPEHAQNTSSSMLELLQILCSWLQLTCTGPTVADVMVLGSLGSPLLEEMNSGTLSRSLFSKAEV